jgi:hypothetical protein
MVNYHSTRKGLKKLQSEALSSFDWHLLPNLYLLYQKKVQIYKVGVPIQVSIEFDVELTQN